MPKANEFYEQCQFILNDKAYEDHKKNSAFVRAIKKMMTDKNQNGLTKEERQSVIFIMNDIVKIKNNYRYCSSVLSLQNTHCDLCGTQIYHVFKIQNEFTNKILNLGSECIVEHAIRIPGYNTAQEMLEFIRGEKERMSNEHKQILWKQNPEYAFDTHGKWLMKILKKYLGLYGNKIWQKDDLDTILHIKKTNAKNIRHWFDSNEFKNSDTFKAMREEILDARKEIVFDVKVPVGQKTIQTIKLKFHGLNLMSDINAQTIGFTKKRLDWYNLNWKLLGMLNSDKDQIPVSKYPEYKYKMRLVMANEEAIYKFIYSTVEYLSTVEKIMNKYEAIVKASISSIDKNEIMTKINERKYEGAKAIMLDVENDGIRWTIDRETYNGIHIVNEKNDTWLPKSKIVCDKEHHFIIMAGWIAKENNVMGAF